MSMRDETLFVGNKTLRRPGAGRPHKYKELEDFIVNKVKCFTEQNTSFVNALKWFRKINIKSFNEVIKIFRKQNKLNNSFSSESPIF